MPPCFVAAGELLCQPVRGGAEIQEQKRSEAMITVKQPKYAIDCAKVTIGMIDIAADCEFLMHLCRHGC